MGGEWKDERQEFYHLHLPYLFRSMPYHYNVAGDFNYEATAKENLT
jgi:hypothetical protein